jgi:PRC-barrel domain
MRRRAIGHTSVMAELPSERQFGDYGDWPGRQVLDPGGDRLGAVREIYLDRETHQPEWVLVAVDGGDERFVPLADAAIENDAIRVAHPREAINAAPGIGTEPRIDPEQERRLYDHYGVAYSEEQSSTVLPEPESEPPTTPGLVPTEPAADEPPAAVVAPEPESQTTTPGLVPTEPAAAEPEPEPEPATVTADAPAVAPEPDTVTATAPEPESVAAPAPPPPVATQPTPPPLPPPAAAPHQDGGLAQRPAVPKLAIVAAVLALLALIWRLRS